MILLNGIKIKLIKGYDNMPSHKIHIKLVIDINKKLNRNIDSLILGSVLPDLTTNGHLLSHFQEDNNLPNNFANAYKFIKKYNLFDDISLGYIIHLLADKYYNNWYYNEYQIDELSKFRENKHKFFDSYDKYILKHFKLNKIDINTINKIPNYKDLEFDKNRLKDYINNYNNEIDNSIIDNNYKIENEEILNNVYNNCLLFITNQLNEILKK